MPPDARTIHLSNVHKVPKSTVSPEIEQKILWAFGKARTEFESTLYQKFHLLSKDIVLSMNEFRWHLENMEERGLITSGEFRGIKSWSMRHRDS
ncbi:MAG: hypothetical protein ACFFEF_07750 [Candidatus Thorarchaeota archaeon]